MKNISSPFVKTMLVAVIMLSSMVVNVQSSISLQPNINGKCPGDLVLIPVYVTGNNVNSLSIYFDFDRGASIASSSTSGNQWYYEGNAITGATSKA